MNLPVSFAIMSSSAKSRICWKSCLAVSRALCLTRQCQGSNPSTPARAVNVPHRILVAVPDPCGLCGAPPRSACVLAPRGGPRTKWSGPGRFPAHEHFRYKGRDGSLPSPVPPLRLHSPTSRVPAPGAAQVRRAAVRRQARTPRRTPVGLRFRARSPVSVKICSSALPSVQGRTTAPASSSLFAAADALLVKLRRTLGPFQPLGLRRHSQVRPLELIHFPPFSIVVVGPVRIFIPSFSFVFLSFVDPREEIGSGKPVFS